MSALGEKLWALYSVRVSALEFAKAVRKDEQLAKLKFEFFLSQLLPALEMPVTAPEVGTPTHVEAVPASFDGDDAADPAPRKSAEPTGDPWFENNLDAVSAALENAEKSQPGANRLLIHFPATFEVDKIPDICRHGKLGWIVPTEGIGHAAPGRPLMQVSAADDAQGVYAGKRNTSTDDWCVTFIRG